MMRPTVASLPADSATSAGKTPIVLVVVRPDQFAVYHLFATACTRHILAEIGMRTAKIAEQWQRQFYLWNLLFRRHGILKSGCDGTSLMGFWI
jgi:hypothetical protein